MQSDIKISVGQAVLDDQNNILHSLIKTAWPTNVSNGILQFLRLFALGWCSDMYLAYFLHHIFIAIHWIVYTKMAILIWSYS